MRVASPGCGPGSGSERKEVCLAHQLSINRWRFLLAEDFARMEELLVQMRGGCGGLDASGLDRYVHEV